MDTATASGANFAATCLFVSAGLPAGGAGRAVLRGHRRLRGELVVAALPAGGARAPGPAAVAQARRRHSASARPRWCCCRSSRWRRARPPTAGGRSSCPPAARCPPGTRCPRLRVVVAYIFVVPTGHRGLAFWLSTKTDAPLGAVGGAVGLTIVGNVLDAVTALGAWREFLPAHWQFAWADALQPDLEWGGMSRARRLGDVRPGPVRPGLPRLPPQGHRVLTLMFRGDSRPSRPLVAASRSIRNVFVCSLTPSRTSHSQVLTRRGGHGNERPDVQEGRTRGRGSASGGRGAAHRLRGRGEHERLGGRPRERLSEGRARAARSRPRRRRRRVGAAARRTTEGGRRKPVAPDYLSTFALDVDTARYGYARRTLADGELPASGDRAARGVRQQLPPGLRAAGGQRLLGDGRRRPGTGEGADAGRRLVARTGRSGHPRRRSARRTPARRPHLRRRHLRLDGRTRPPRPGRRSPSALLTDELRDDDSVVPGHLQRRGGDPAADDPARRQPRPDPRRRRPDGADRLTNVGGGVSDGYEERGRGPRARAPPTGSSCSPTPSPTPARPTRTPSSNGSTRPPRVRHHPLRRRRRQRLRRRADGAPRQQGRRPHTYIADATQAARSSSTSSPPTSNSGHATPRPRSPSTRETVQQFRLIGYENREGRRRRLPRRQGGRRRGGPRPHGDGALRRTAPRRRLRPCRDRDRALAGPEDPGAARGVRIGGDRRDRGRLWDGDRGRRLQVTAVAAYFAEDAARRRAAGSPGLGELAERAEEAGDRHGGQLGAEAGDRDRQGGRAQGRQRIGRRGRSRKAGDGLTAGRSRRAASRGGRRADRGAGAGVGLAEMAPQAHPTTP